MTEAPDPELSEVRGTGQQYWICPTDFRYKPVWSYQECDCHEPYFCCDGRPECGGVNEDGWEYHSHLWLRQFYVACAQWPMENECPEEERVGCRKKCFWSEDCTGHVRRQVGVSVCTGCSFDEPAGWNWDEYGGG